MDKKTELIHRLRVDFLSKYGSSELYHEMDSVVNEMTGYLSRALPFREGDTGGDYDHLARVLEWSAGGDGDGGEGGGE